MFPAELRTYLEQRLNAESPSWHVEVVAEPIVQACLEFRAPVEDLGTPAKRRRWSNLLARTCCRQGMRRPLSVRVGLDCGKYVVLVMEKEYRKRGAASVIAAMIEEFRRGEFGVRDGGGGF